MSSCGRGRNRKLSLLGSGCLATAASVMAAAEEKVEAAEEKVPVGTFPSFMAEGTLLARRGEHGKALACFNNVSRLGGAGRVQGEH